MDKQKIKFIITSAFIAALYAALTYASAFFGIAYGGIQFRISEALTVLPVFTPAAIPGLFIGCILGNLSSPYGLPDIICGSAASFIAAFLTYMLRNIKIKNIPVFAFLPPILINGIVVGWEIACSTTGEFNILSFSLPIFIVQGAFVALGQSVIILLLGVPLCLYLNKQNLFSDNYLK